MFASTVNFSGVHMIMNICSRRNKQTTFLFALIYLYTLANNMEPEQTAPIGFILFASMVKVFWSAYAADAISRQHFHLLSPLLMYFGSKYCKQYVPHMSSLNRVHSVCFHRKFSGVHMNSRYTKQTTFS